ncbi:MAG: serine/threonine-protein phosphatase [Anaerolineaceae bacterium]|nr:MAG: serine/threonine-protein phosphatase [Anaerolineaceae bacterium]
MDLFRRIFGKTSEEMPIEKPADSASNVTEEGGGNELIDPNATAELSEDPQDFDPQTRPVRPAALNSAQDGMTRPLEQADIFELSSVNSGSIVFGQASDVGLVRSNNQDAVLSFFSASTSVDEYPDFGLFVVADGMGGHQEGEKASAIATRTIAAHVASSIYMPIISGTAQENLPPIGEALVEGVQKSNKGVMDSVPDGGTTVTAVAVMNDLAYVAHVGDSRAYLMTSEGIEQITRDHSLVQRLIELNQLTREEAETHPQKNVLYRALGQNESVEVDTLTRRLPVNSRLLLCSDGLWGQLEERDLYEIAFNTSNPQEACDKLVALAKNNGGTDNITIILLKIS